MNILRYTILGILPFVFLPLLISQTTSPSYQFQHLSESNGLASNRVHCGLLDKQGFMWFGTHTGLSRWDGMEFKNFYPDSPDSTSPTSALVTSLLEDKEGYIWIASHSGDLSRYDSKTQSFKSYSYPVFADSTSITAPMKLFQGSDGFIWIGAFDEGFLKFNPTTGEFKRYNLQNSVAKELKFTNNSVLDILEDVENPDLLWLASNNGLYKFDKTTEQLNHYPSPHPKTSGMGIQRLVMTHSDHLWFATYGAGLVKFDKQTQNWQYHLPNPSAWQELNFTHNILTDIAPKSKEEFWITSKDKGAGIFNINTKEFSFYKHDGESQNSIISNIGYKLYTDNKQRIWFLMNEKGISYIDPNFQNFRFHTLPNPISSEKRTPFEVKDFLHDEKTNKLLIIGKATNGLYQLDQNYQLQQRIPLKGYENQYQIYKDILQTSDGKIWVAGTHSKGRSKDDPVIRPSLLQLNEQGNLLLPYSTPDIIRLQLQKENIVELIELAPNQLWGITSSGLLFKLQTDSGKVEIFKPSKEEFPVQSTFQTIIKQSESTKFLIGTNNGLVSFDYNTAQFEFYSATASLNIRSLLENNQKLWIGTFQLKCLDLVSKQLEPLADYINKPISPVDQLVLDKKNRLWFTTQQGLVYLDSISKSFVNFRTKNGLYKEFFYYNGVYLLPNGSILLGKEDGFFSFTPDKVLNSIESDTLVFTDIKINNQAHNLSFKKAETPQLNLSHKENSLHLSFSPLVFTNQEKIPLMYQLVGIDEDWVFPIKNSNFAIYNKLPYGDYQFKVKKLLQPNEEPLQLNVSISPPFHKTTWAYLCYCLLSLGLAYRSNHFFSKQRFITHETQRLKEINQFKSKLYTNITHEFRTPLTVISGMANQIEQPETKRLIQKNSRSLLNLVNQILDLSKIEAKSMQPSYTQADIIIYLKYLVSTYQPFADTQNKCLSFTSEIATLVMDYDASYIKRIMNNLLANALKFTKEFEKIQVQVSTTTIDTAQKKQQATLVIAVKDEGLGIPKDQLNQIFERFYQVNTSQLKEGTGIGLTLVKELTELLNGQVYVKSKLGEGSVFYIQLPITNKAIKEEEIPKPKVPIILPSPLLAATSSLCDSKKTLPLLLIIEDNQDVIEYMQAFLQKDYRIEIAQNGKIGIEKAINSIPDIILSDIMMPEMNGFQVCESLKNTENTSHIPIILLTAKATQDDKLKGLDCGADAFLTKPFNQEELLIRLKHIVRQQQKHQAFYSQYKSLPQDIPIENEFLQKVQTIIAENYQDNTFSLPSLCEQLFLSRTQVFRKVKALTNTSPSDMILHYRLEQGKKLLLNQNLNITEIAFQVGFKSQAHFSAAYKKYFKISPSTQRKTKKV